MGPSRTIRLSPRVVLVPAGTRPPATPPEVLTLPVRPSAAFGDGSHPTTRLCAEVVDLLCRRSPPPASVLDVGTGTGVLARIARARGVPFVAATDVDPVALAAAREHVALDAHPTPIAVSDAPPDAWGPRFELVVANILEEVLASLAAPLAAALAPGGVLLVSGFTPLQIPRVTLAFTEVGLTLERPSTREGWALLMLRREGAIDQGASTPGR